MPDLNEQYLEGVGKLLGLLGPQHGDYLAVLTLQGRLAGLIQDMRQYGATMQARAELARVTTELNRLCLKNLEPTQSFNDLCGIAPSQAPEMVPGTIGQRFLSGAVLYANVVGFSTLPHKSQNAAVEFMDREVRRFLDAFGPGCWLDFRGGDFLLFLERKPDEWRVDTLVKVFILGLQLQLKALGQSFRLGVTLHWEDDATWHYLGNRLHLAGSAINAAQLFMSFSDGGHFFLSTDAYRDLGQQLHEAERTSFGDLLGAINSGFDNVWPDLRLLEQTYKTCECHCEIFTFHDRHKRQHDLYNLYAMDSRHIYIGDPSTPRHRVAIEYRDRRVVEPEQVFIQRLVEADEVTIVALTHEGTVTFLQKALEVRKKDGRGFWNQLRIIFPSQLVLDTVIEEDRTPEVRLARWQGGKRAIFMFLLAQGPACLGHWECLEFEGNLPFVGNWFISEQNASIRVAPILPGCDMQKSYYMEVFKGMEAYTQLAQAFSVICSRSSQVVEWDIYGQLKDGELQYQGIVNRQRWDEVGQIGRFCFPVVLVMLHTDIEGGPKSILQERTIFNASDDIGTFSNISGRVTDMDIYTAKALALPPYIDHQDTDDDIATAAFNDRTGMRPGDPLPPGTWEAAAIREIQEEIGLRVTPDRLSHHCTYHLKRANGDLFFKIFSLKLRRTLNVNEIKVIEDSRPYVKLSAFDLPRLRHYYENAKFNRLLQREFERVFVPIFHELGIG